MMFRNKTCYKNLAAVFTVGILTVGGLVIGGDSAANAGTFPGCTAQQLRTAVTQHYAGMSHQGVDIDLTNVSGSTCIVFGGMDGVIRSDRVPARVQIGATQFSVAKPSIYVPLKPGEAVRSNLAWDVMAPSVEPHEVAVTINNGLTSVNLPLVETQNITSYRATNFQTIP